MHLCSLTWVARLVRASVEKSESAVDIAVVGAVVGAAAAPLVVSTTAAVKVR